MKEIAKWFGTKLFLVLLLMVALVMTATKATACGGKKSKWQQVSATGCSAQSCQQASPTYSKVYRPTYQATCQATYQTPIATSQSSYITTTPIVTMQYGKPVSSSNPVFMGNCPNGNCPIR